MSDNIINSTDESFQADLDNAASRGCITLVDFWAPWCNPCKSIATHLDELSVEFKDKVQILKIDIDQNFKTGAKYGVRGIPTMIMFEGNNTVGSKVGAHNKEILRLFIASNLDKWQ
jgi:thioredoxin 1